MSREIDFLISYIRSEKSLRLSPIMRQLLVTRIELEPTEGEIERARDKVMGRSRVGNPN